MEYRKENHFIVAYEGEKLKGKWDIVNNQYVGVKGGILKQKSPAFTTENIRTMDNVLRSAYIFMGYADRWNPFTEKHGQRIEEIISVGLAIQSDWALWRDFLSDKNKLTKEYVQFIKDNFNGVYCRSCVSGFRIYKDFTGLINKCGDKKDWAMETIRSIHDYVPHDFIEGMILRAIHEKVFVSKRAYDFANLINNWYDYIAYMGDKLEVKHNILTNYTILQWIYNEYKTAHYDEKLQSNNDLPWLYFEDSNYTVFPLLSRADFHKEAEAQQNCVERMYMDSVAEGHTHVVAVRLKTNPDAPYITCEVDNNGRIVQYLLRFNHYPQNINDCEFKTKYAVHLISSLNQ